MNARVARNLYVAGVVAVTAAVATLIAIDTTATGGDPFSGSPGVTSSARSPSVGGFTGEYIDGVPVYRLPPLIVVADPAVLDRWKSPRPANRAGTKVASRPAA